MIGEGAWPAAPMKNNTIDPFKTLKVGMFVCVCFVVAMFVGFCCSGAYSLDGSLCEGLPASIIFHEMVPMPTRACAARFA